MNKRTQQLLGLIVLLASCVAVGSWMQQRNAVSAVRLSYERYNWSQLERRLDNLITEAGLSTGGERVISLDTVRNLAAKAAPSYSHGAGILIVDPHWRLLGEPIRPERSEGQTALHAGESTKWAPLRNSAVSNGGMTLGTLTLADGRHLAVSRALPDGRGYVVAHRSAAAVRAEADSLTRSFPALGAVSLAWTVALLSIAIYVTLGKLYESLDKQRTQSNTDALRQSQSLVRTRDAVIFGLAKLADSRDTDTGEHLDRISAYSTTLANALRNHPKYGSLVTPAFVRLIGISAALHDIGKVGIPDRVLLKPGKLTDEERTVMEEHPLIGGQCLREIEQRLGSSNFLQMAREIAYAHHERWDGKGYPDGLAGKLIPLAARIVAIADVYDALSSKRVYKDPFAHEKCAAIIYEGAGTQFDPDLIEIWRMVEDRFRQIARRQKSTAAVGENLGIRSAAAQTGRPPETNEERPAAEALAPLAATVESSAADDHAPTRILAESNS